MSQEERLIVFYDGDCGFCNRSVQFVLKNDRQSRIYFSALQSDWSVNFFHEQGMGKPDMSTFYFWNGTKMYKRSTAALKVLTFLRFPWPLFFLFIIVPRFFRDWVYNQIAQRRHRIQSGFCVLPDHEQQKRFLKN